MPPNSYDVTLSKDELAKSEKPKFNVSVIDFPNESGDIVTAVPFEEALKEIGECCEIGYQ